MDGADAIRATFLGTGDAFASGGRSHACVLVEGLGYRLLVDCGAGAPVALRRAGAAPASIDGIVLTHLHGDHAAGVPFLLLDAVYNEPRSTPLTIAGPPGTEELTLALTELLYPGVAGKARSAAGIRFVALAAPGRAAVGPFTVASFPAIHGSSGQGLILRVEGDDRVLAFSGDTAWTPALVEASRDADLFVCECTSYDEPLPGHLSHAQLLERRSELTPRRIILTHLGRSVLARLDHLAFETAHDGMVVSP